MWRDWTSVGVGDGLIVRVTKDSGFEVRHLLTLPTKNVGLGISVREALSKLVSNPSQDNALGLGFLDRLSGRNATFELARVSAHVWSATIIADDVYGKSCQLVVQSHSALQALGVALARWAGLSDAAVTEKRLPELLDLALIDPA